MEFNDEQMAAINVMIAAKVGEATTDLNSQIDALNKHKNTLIGEKRAKDEEARQARETADQAERDRLETSGDVESYKARVTSLEDRIKERDDEIRSFKFDEAISKAVGARNIRPELRPELEDSIRYRAKYDNGSTSVNGLTVDEYLDDVLKSDRGQHYIPASVSSGGNAPGAISGSALPSMTKDDFNMTKFAALPKAERDAFADRNNIPHLKSLP